MEVHTFWSTLPILLIPPPLATTSLFSVSMILVFYLYVCHIHGFSLICSPHISEVIWYLSFLLSMMPSRSIHIVANGKISFFFLWLSNIPLSVCVCVQTHTHRHTHTPYCLYPFICWCTLRLFPFLDYAAVNMGVQIAFQISVFVFFG